MSSSIRLSLHASAFAFLAFSTSLAYAQAQPPQRDVLSRPAPELRMPGAKANAPVESEITLPPGATIGDATERVRALAAEASRSLDELVGTSLTPREEAEVDALAERQRRIMLLTSQLQEVKLAKEIYTELHGKEDPKNNEEVKRLEADKQRLEEQIRVLETRPPQDSHAEIEVKEESPVVSSVSASNGIARAVILVPYSGVVHAQVGTVLVNGMKVVSIAQSGVVVDSKSGRVTLPFGSSVPQSRQTSQQGAQGYPVRGR